MSQIKDWGCLLLNEPLSNYNTWRVGGLASKLFKPNDLAGLSMFLKQLPHDEPILFLGLGSNSLIADEGFPGTVILMQGTLKNMEQISAHEVEIGAGVSCAQMARFCARNALVNAEFLAGIPGTVGGALRMNAGCYQSETWQYVVSVETIDRQGTIRRREAKEFNIAYRHIDGLAADEWFVSATFSFPQGNAEVSLQKIKDLLAKRAASQPTGEYNCGSVFRNPPGDFAARLIEACGLKGYRIGGAQVSTKHANFIINEDASASAQDISDLIAYVQEQVKTQFGIDLVPEVHKIGVAK